MLLVPGDPLNPRRVDPHFADQASAARDRGIAVARIDHDALDDPERAVAECRRARMPFIAGG